MSSLKSLSDSELLSKTEWLALEERKVHRALLEHLAEIDRRRLHAALGFPSLFDYVTKHLKYSESSAQRRIAAMRLMREVPVVAAKVESGELSLSVIAQAQSIFREAARTAPIAAAAKAEVLQSLEGCSAREAERRLAERFPAAAAARAARAVERPIWTGGDRTQVTMDLTSEQRALLDSVRARVGNPALGWAEAFEHLARFYLTRTDPARRVREVRRKPAAAEWKPSHEVTPTPVSPKKKSGPLIAPTRQESNFPETAADIEPNLSVATSAVETDQVVAASGAQVPAGRAHEIRKALFLVMSDPDLVDEKINSAPRAVLTPDTRHIPASVRREVWRRDDGRCTFRSRISGRACASAVDLELDHLDPWACGGSNDAENLTLRCRAHNALSAEQVFGAQVPRAG